MAVCSFWPLSQDENNVWSKDSKKSLSFRDDGFLSTNKKLYKWRRDLFDSGFWTHILNYLRNINCYLFWFLIYKVLYSLEIWKLKPWSNYYKWDIEVAGFRSTKELAPSHLSKPYDFLPTLGSNYCVLYVQYILIHSDCIVRITVGPSLHLNSIPRKVAGIDIGQLTYNFRRHPRSFSTVRTHVRKRSHPKPWLFSTNNLPYRNSLSFFFFFSLHRNSLPSVIQPILV